MLNDTFFYIILLYSLEAINIGDTSVYIMYLKHLHIEIENYWFLVRLIVRFNGRM